MVSGAQKRIPKNHAPMNAEEIKINKTILKEISEKKKQRNDVEETAEM